MFLIFNQLNFIELTLFNVFNWFVTAAEPPPTGQVT